MPNEKVFVENTIAVWKSALERADKLFASFEEKELLKEVAPGRNRLVYLWGHLTAMHDRMLVLLGISDRIHSDFDSVFLTSVDKANEVPPVENIRLAWKQVNDRLNEGISKFSAAQWLEKHAAVSEDDFVKDPLRNRLSILLTRTNHLTYHLGQAVLARR